MSKEESTYGKLSYETKMIGGTLFVEQKVPMEQQSVRSVTLPQFPSDSGFSSSLDCARNYVDVWEKTPAGKNLKAYLRIAPDNTCQLTRETGQGYLHKEPFPTYDEARLYLEAVLLLDIQPD